MPLTPCCSECPHPLYEHYVTGCRLCESFRTTYCPQEDRRGRRCRNKGKIDMIAPSGYRTETPVCGVHAQALARQGWKPDLVPLVAR